MSDGGLFNHVLSLYFIRTIFVDLEQLFTLTFHIATGKSLITVWIHCPDSIICALRKLFLMQLFCLIHAQLFL